MPRSPLGLSQSSAGRQCRCVLVVVRSVGGIQKRRLYFFFPMWGVCQELIPGTEHFLSRFYLPAATAEAILGFTISCYSIGAELLAGRTARPLKDKASSLVSPRSCISEQHGFKPQPRKCISSELAAPSTTRSYLHPDLWSCPFAVMFLLLSPTPGGSPALPEENSIQKEVRAQPRVSELTCFVSRCRSG